MARIAGVDIPNAKRVEIALTYIYGIGRTSAKKILEVTGINPDPRAKDLTEEEIAKIENPREIAEFIETDTSLIQIPKETEPVEGEDTPEDQGPKPDEWGLIDEDGDGIILEEVKGEGYSGYMMVVLDPSRVIVGSVPGAQADEKELGLMMAGGGKHEA